MINDVIDIQFKYMCASVYSIPVKWKKQKIMLYKYQQMYNLHSNGF